MGVSGDCATAGTCTAVQHGFFSSPPSLAGSGVFLAAFAVLVPINLFTGMRYNTPLYSSGIAGGLLFEVAGYVGRILLNSNTASVASFVIYMLGTIIGPAFMTSAVYQILPHVVVLYGKQFTLVSQPAYFWVLFLALDLLTLVTEAAGVALAATGGSQAEISRGINVLLAGLGMQLASGALFLAIYWYFVHKLHHRRYILDPAFEDVYLSPRFRAFLLCAQVSTVLILGRTAARFAALLGGFSNPLNQSQHFTLVLDGCLVFVAATILTFIPVGSAFRSAWHATSPQLRQRRSAGRRSGYRPADISLPVPTPLPQAYSPGSPPYYYSARSSPGQQPAHALSPPLPTVVPSHPFAQRSPPYHQDVGGYQPQAAGPVWSPVKASPGAPARPPYEFYGGGQSQGGGVMAATPGYNPGRPRGSAPGHRRPQTSTTLVDSDALW